MQTLIIPLVHPRGSITSAEADITAEYGQFKAWIWMAGENIEFQSIQPGTRVVRTWYPFEGHDTYRFAGDIHYRKMIQSFADWIEWLKEYVGGLDPRDVFRYRRKERL